MKITIYFAFTLVIAAVGAAGYGRRSDSMEEYVGERLNDRRNQRSEEDGARRNGNKYGSVPRQERRGYGVHSTKQEVTFGMDSEFDRRIAEGLSRIGFGKELKKLSGRDNELGNGKRSGRFEHGHEVQLTRVGYGRRSEESSEDGHGVSDRRGSDYGNRRSEEPLGNLVKRRGYGGQFEDSSRSNYEESEKRDNGKRAQDSSASGFGSRAFGNQFRKLGGGYRRQGDRNDENLRSTNGYGIGTDDQASGYGVQFQSKTRLIGGYGGRDSDRRRNRGQESGGYEEVDNERNSHEVSEEQNGGEMHYNFKYEITLPEDEHKSSATWAGELGDNKSGYNLQQIHPYEGRSNVFFSMENEH